MTGPLTSDNIVNNSDECTKEPSGDFWKNILLHPKYKEMVKVHGEIKPLLDSILGMDSGVSSSRYTFHPY